jgi:hypothetical protein
VAAAELRRNAEAAKAGKAADPGDEGGRHREDQVSSR